MAASVSGGQLRGWTLPTDELIYSPPRTSAQYRWRDDRWCTSDKGSAPHHAKMSGRRPQRMQQMKLREPLDSVFDSTRAASFRTFPYLANVLRLSGRSEEPPYGYHDCDFQLEADTMSETGRSNVLSDCAAGLVVSSAKLRSFFGSIQHTVPVEPLWPNTSGEQPFPN
jgi:hypothetical protein